MNFNRALNKEQTTCINGIFVLFVFLSHFGQYETMPWNHLLLAIGQLMVAPFLFYSGIWHLGTNSKKEDVALY